ncbi:hypothetical protein EGW08_014632 [Elysia chlorotica]|uniref:Uncharacterized protein n=1 Tax=Elysia chlorotica TaxID=188477 RepID=A0A3S0ZLF9_ELYCH|nr:hypothetical protein EGW08_014632 [Elysia chlorotica]
MIYTLCTKLQGHINGQLDTFFMLISYLYLMPIMHIMEANPTWRILDEHFSKKKRGKYIYIYIYPYKHNSYIMHKEKNFDSFYVTVFSKSVLILLYTYVNLMSFMKLQ